MNIQPSPSNILARARRLGTAAVVAAAAHVADAGQLTLDYTGVSTYSNSGFFTGSVAPGNTGGAIIANGFKLYGSETISDSLFWRWDQNYQQTVPGYDTTGIAFIWGGKITGGTTSADTLTAPFEFSLDFTNLGLEEYPRANVAVSVGYSGYEYVPSGWQSAPLGQSWGSDTQWYNFDAPGTYEISGTASTNLTDSSDTLYWFAQATVNWESEFVSSRNWNGGYGTLNGDTLTFTIPQNSIDVAYLPAAAPSQGVPDGGATVGLLGAAIGALAFFQRLRRQRL